MKILILSGHPLSDAVQFRLRELWPDAVKQVVIRPFHTERVDDLYGALVTWITDLDRDYPLAGFGQIAIIPPGMSGAAFLLPALIKGITGDFPDLINLRRGPGGEYVCCDPPLVKTNAIFAHMRQQRKGGYQL